MAAQIAHYKAHRRLFQYGRFLRLCPPFGKKQMRVDDACAGWKLRPWWASTCICCGPTRSRPCGWQALAQDALYELEVRPQVVDVRTFGSLIN